jgi:hypothetical protein
VNLLCNADLRSWKLKLRNRAPHTAPQKATATRATISIAIDTIAANTAIENIAQGRPYSIS